MRTGYSRLSESQPETDESDAFWNQRGALFPQPDIKSSVLRWLDSIVQYRPLKFGGIQLLENKRLVASGTKNFALESAIDESENLLELQPDWDESESPSIDHATWQRAVDVLRDVCSHPDAEVPRILPGPEGSIDLHWKTDRHELLVNVPADSDQPCDFYGDNYGKFSVKGQFHPDESIPPLAILLHDCPLAR